jgi:hypothetical protein
MSALEDQFLDKWQASFPELVLEREFSDIEAWEKDFQERHSKSKRSKRYRLDFAHPLSRIGIEIQGGVYNRGRHVTGSGYERDCRKYNLAFTSGWTIYLLTATMAKDSTWHELIADQIVAGSVQSALSSHQS